MGHTKTWDELTIQDNFLFQKVMRNKRICKHLIEKILQIKIKKITYPDEEKTIDIRLDSKSVRLDVYVQDDAGTIYDIEMQTTDGKDGALAKRTRYYQAMIDMDVLGKGHDYTELNPSYIIFICTFDLFQRNFPIYTFDQRCLEDISLSLGDQATKIFLNSKGRTTGIDPDIAAFLQYVDGKASERTFIRTIADEVQRIKNHDETRREYMTLAMELERQKRQGYAEGLEKGVQQGIQQGVQQGMQQGKAETKTEIISSMLHNGLDYELIAKCTNLSIDYIKEIAQKNRLL